jgi:hypothetical protein
VLRGPRRDGVAEGVGGDVVENVGEALLDLLAHDVLPAAGLVVDESALDADDVQQQSFSEPVLADHVGGTPAALIGELQGAVLGNLDETITLHARHRLGHRGTRVVETLDDAGTQRGNAVLLKLIHGLEVHLGGVDQLGHGVGSCLRWVTADIRCLRKGSLTEPRSSPG